ncbi:hypothetical protein OH77DRAFT_1421250 [Trametes cingulata]|nr:hypothetical protein OH77DRAFT_1421250 [Trametes cingulata]
MPPYSSAAHDHAPPPEPSQNAVADPPPSSAAAAAAAAKATSYTSLKYALTDRDPFYHRQVVPHAAHMSTDSRYMYHHAQPEFPHPPAYPYSAYPPAAAYENGQYAQGSSRPPVRTPPPPPPPAPHPQPQPVQHAPPPTAQYGPPPPAPGYPPQQGYPPQAYGVPPPPPQQWQGEWPHHGAPAAAYPPPHPQQGQQQPAYAAPPARPEPPQGAAHAHDDRRYQQPPPRPEPRRTDERPPPPQRQDAAPPQQPVRKTRQDEPPKPPPPVPVQAQVQPPPQAHPQTQAQQQQQQQQPPPPQQPPAPPPAQAPAPPVVSPVGIDFSKLLESYRIIIDSANALAYEATQPRAAATAETIERMRQAASYGAQALDAAAKRIAPEPPRPQTGAPGADRAAEEGEGDAARTRQSENQPATEGQTCLGCSATSTPEWRRGPMGECCRFFFLHCWLPLSPDSDGLLTYRDARAQAPGRCATPAGSCMPNWCAALPDPRARRPLTSSLPLSALARFASLAGPAVAVAVRHTRVLAG